MKCEVPSFVSDFVDVENWRDSQGNTFLPGDDYGIIELRRLFTTLWEKSPHTQTPVWSQFFLFYTVVQQFYQSRVIDEFVLKGNTGILKCLVPSFVTDFVQIEAWIADDGTTYSYDPKGQTKFGNWLVQTNETTINPSYKLCSKCPINYNNEHSKNDVFFTVWLVRFVFFF